MTTTSIFDFSTFPNLTTERLYLRELTADDTPVIQEMFSSPDVLRFLNLPVMDTPEKALGVINWLSEHYESHEAVNWAITLRENGRMIGTSGTHNWDRSNRRVDIGYNILPVYWGKGYATEATHAMLRWCFDNLDVHRVQADCTEGNIASERVMLKCGFTFEGIWRESCWEHGRFVNIKQFGLLKREYTG